MKKFLCVLMIFALLFSCAIAEENIEESVSSIVTFGPVSFDTFGKWETITEGHCEKFEIDEMLFPTDNHDEFFLLVVQDLWNGALTEEKRIEYFEQGLNQEDYDSVDLASQLMKIYIEQWGGKPKHIEPVKLGEYEFCRMPYVFTNLQDLGVHMWPYWYLSVENGYLIMIAITFSPNSVYYDDFINTMDTLEIGITNMFDN